MRGLRFFQRTNTSRCFNLASYHDPRSLTWSWLLSWDRYLPGETRRWFRIRRYYGTVTIDVARLRSLRFQRQEKMFIRSAA